MVASKHKTLVQLRDGRQEICQGHLTGTGSPVPQADHSMSHFLPDDWMRMGPHTYLFENMCVFNVDTQWTSTTA